MTPERWHQVERICQVALDKGPSERAAFLVQACGEDAELRREVDTLLDAHEMRGSFLEVPPLEATASAASGAPKIYLSPGQRVGSYELIALVGSGGMGEVWQALDVGLNRQVAIKVLQPRFSSDPDRLRRFEQEARAAGMLSHPNVLAIHAIGSHDGAPYLVTELLEGVTLRARLAGAAIPEPRAIEYADQITQGLIAAHHKGIVHRDLKPENIFVTTDGRVKILDFGLAKLLQTADESSAPTQTGSGIALGTPAYMSPEQVQGRPADHRSDIFALGAVLYEMLAGRRAFPGDTGIAAMHAVLTETPPPIPGASPQIEQIARRCLEKEPARRYQSARDLGDQVRLLRQLPASSPRPPTWGWRRSRWPWVAAAALAGIVLLLSLGLPRLPGTAPRTLAEQDVIVVADFENATGDPVFDGTLKVALAVALEQSPFLRVLSDERVQETLRLMGRPSNERVTRVVAREVARREQLKALIAGSVSSLGRRYVLGLEAVNAETGDVMARNQVEIASKEEVISALGVATAQFRERLGESLVSIQRYDVPLARATTPSLEALHAYSLGLDQGRFVPQVESIPHFMRAIELDPNFALALAQLSGVYSNTLQSARAPEFSRRAFELRDRVSERERYFISWRYYLDAVMAWEKALELARSWTATYPREAFAFNSLGVAYMTSGQFLQAGEAYREAIRLDPRFVVPYGNLAASLLALNRFDDAKVTLRKVEELGRDYVGARRIRFLVAFAEGDRQAMAQQVESPSGGGQLITVGWTATASAFGGQMKAAHEQFRRAIQTAQQGEFKQMAAQLSAEDAAQHATVGQCEQARRETRSALALSRDIFTLEIANRTMALCDGRTDAAALSKELAERFPEATLVVHLSIPLTMAALALDRGDAEGALEVLDGVSRYDHAPAASFWPSYLRGQAHLRLKAGQEAATAFQHIMDHRGESVTSPLYPLAHLGLARAAILMKDTAKAQQAYGDFLALWAAADPDLPPLREAREELARLRDSDVKRSKPPSVRSRP